MRRVLRVMRAAALLAPARQPVPVVAHPHDGTIVTDQPNVMWGTDATATVTVARGRSRSSPRSITAPPSASASTPRDTGTRFEALEPLRQGVRDHFGGLAAAAAVGLALRHDHGSVYLSDDFQAEIAFLGMTRRRRSSASPKATAVSNGSFGPSRNSCSGFGTSAISPTSKRRSAPLRTPTTSSG